ncbi:MAG: acyltransferase family protein [Crenarchaeota archaeon]|nr:acyltransferase family protein [Thermoproteota archaeon]
MKKLNQLNGRVVYVDLIRCVAMIGVILLHAAGRYPIDSSSLLQFDTFGTLSWVIVDFYQSIAIPFGVPLFLMLTGALLLQPEKKDSLSIFFKKRWVRIGLPSLFWFIAYFIWDFSIQKIPFSLDAIIQGILNGPYTQMWYLYVLVGLYLLTPLLRIFIAHADQKIIKYFLIVWFFGVSVIPFFELFIPYHLNSNVFTLTGYVGFFVLGTYLLKANFRRLTSASFASLGVVLTVIATYILAATIGGMELYFFQQYFSITVIFTAVMTFSFLLTINPPTLEKKTSFFSFHKLIQLISHNTLGIFFVHVMVIESTQRGYFGFAFNQELLNPIVEIPLLTAFVLFVSLGIILILKKVPYLNKLIGVMGV